MLRDKVTVESLRPLPLFLGITGPAFCLGPDAFTPPTKRLDKTTMEKVLSRLTLNLAFFMSNYVLIAVGVAVVVALMSPRMLLYVSTVLVLWWLHTYSVANGIPIIIFGKDFGDVLSERRRSIMLKTISIFVVVFYCLLPAIYAISISGIIIFSHALLRDPKNIENSGSFSGRTYSDEDDDSCEEVMVNRSDIDV